MWKPCAEAAAGGGLVLIYASVRKKEAAYSRTLRDATRRASRGGSLMTIAYERREKAKVVFVVWCLVLEVLRVTIILLLRCVLDKFKHGL